MKSAVAEAEKILESHRLKLEIRDLTVGFQENFRDFILIFITEDMSAEVYWAEMPRERLKTVFGILKETLPEE